ncbi:hypothetical protein KY284_001218 [Solanum tuberosum]|nr:hypothetical protein KY284_001218 [Solanum tuberosum]
MSPNYGLINARSISDYMREIKSNADDFFSSGSPVNNEELVIKVLCGLGPEYKELSVAIRARDNPITFEVLIDKLFAQEMFIKHLEPKVNTPMITAQLHQHSTNNGPKNRQPNSSNRRNTTPSGSYNSRKQFSAPNNNSFTQQNTTKSNNQRTPTEFCGTDAIIDLSTGGYLLQCKSNGDLCHCPMDMTKSVTPRPQAHFVASTTPSLHLWHARVDHPQPRITKACVSSFNLPVNHVKSFTFFLSTTSLGHGKKLCPDDSNSSSSSPQSPSLPIVADPIPIPTTTDLVNSMSTRVSHT